MCLLTFYRFWKYFLIHVIMTKYQFSFWTHIFVCFVCVYNEGRPFLYFIFLNLSISIHLYSVGNSSLSIVVCRLFIFKSSENFCYVSCHCGSTVDIRNDINMQSWSQCLNPLAFQDWGVGGILYICKRM